MLRFRYCRVWNLSLINLKSLSQILSSTSFLTSIEFLKFSGSTCNSIASVKDVTSLGSTRSFTLTMFLSLASCCYSFINSASLGIGVKAGITVFTIWHVPECLLHNWVSSTSPGVANNSPFICWPSMTYGLIFKGYEVTSVCLLSLICFILLRVYPNRSLLVVKNELGSNKSSKDKFCVSFNRDVRRRCSFCFARRAASSFLCSAAWSSIFWDQRIFTLELESI